MSSAEIRRLPPDFSGHDDSVPAVSSIESEGAAGGELTDDSTHDRPGAEVDADYALDTQATVISDSQRPQSTTGHAALAMSAKEMEGQQLGHFRLEQIAGGGGMGAVFLATDLILGRRVAVKILPPDRSRDRDTVCRFENEAQSAARLDHENIARVFHFGEEDGLKYIVFEYVDGINIRDLIVQRGPLPVNEAVSYVLQIAEALSHAATRSVVHRDIKPANVIVTTDGQAKLVDLGLARFDHLDSANEDLTATGVTLGSFDYISPEQARDPRLADVRSDLYSLGCTFYFMLTGRPPFPQGTVLQKLLSHSSDVPTDPRVLRPDLPESVAAIVRRLMAKDPENRFQEPRNLTGELLLAADQLGLQPISSGGAVWIESTESSISRFEKHVPWLAPMIILLAAIVAMEWVQSDRDMVTLAQLTQPQSPAAVSRESDQTINPLGDSTEASSNSRSPAQESFTQTSDDSDLPTTTEIVVGSQSDAQADVPNITAPDPLVPVSQGTSQPFLGNSLDQAFPEIGATGRNPVSSWTDWDPTRTEVNEDVISDDVSAETEPRLNSGNALIGSAPRPDTLIVGQYDPSSPWDKNLFCESLSAACRKAAATQPEIKVIELRYDGYRGKPEEPLTVAIPELTIRPADGFSPVVRFEPNSESSSVSPTSMVRIVGGRFRIEGIRLEFNVPTGPEAQWELLQLEQVEELEIVGCLLTVRDPSNLRWSGYETARSYASHDRIAVVDLNVPAGHDSMMDEDQEEMELLTVIDITDTVIRGEVTVIRAKESVPFRFRWDNGLLATSERLLSVGGQRNSPDENENHIQIDLSHVTAYARRGLCLFDSDHETYRHMVTVDINCSQCILMTAPIAPLIELIGPGDQTPAELSQKLVFSGERNFFENVVTFWRVKTRRPISSGPDDYLVEQYDAEDWKQRWRETLSKVNRVAWRQLPQPDRPIHEHAPEDYLLEERRGNPAIASGAGPRREDAGLLIERLRSAGVAREYLSISSETEVPF